MCGRATACSSLDHLNHLAELEGDTLSLYGTGALDAFERTWGLQAAGAVTTVIFKFIDFEEIIRHLHKVRVRFPNTHVSHRVRFSNTHVSHRVRFPSSHVSHRVCIT